MAGTPGRSGGARQGRPGRKYANRSDMRQAPKAATGQTYGMAKQQLDAQKQIPLVNNSSAAPTAGPSPAQAAPAGGGGPQVLPSLTAPTARPNEPITAGLDSGPGAGPSGPPADPTLAMLQGAYKRFPNNDLLALIQEAQKKGLK